MAANREECVTVLVTGGAGFIGRHLVRELVAEGHVVGVLDSLVEQVHGPSPTWPADLPGSVVRWRSDVRDRRAVARVLRDLRPHVVVHLAAEVGVGQAEAEPARYLDANVVGTGVLLEAIAAQEHAGELPPVERLVVAGSMSSYGEGVWHCPVHGGPMRPIRRDADLHRGWDPLCPAHGVDTGRPCSGELEPRPTPEWASLQAQGVYAMSKRCQEDLALFHARNHGLSTAVTRFFNVWGPGQAPGNPYTGVVVGFGARARNGVAPVVFEDGRQARDFVHVADVAAALRLLVGSPAVRIARRAWAAHTHQGVFNVGTGVATQVLEVADLACEVLAPHLAPELPGIGRRGDVRLCVADPSRLLDLGWRPIRSVDPGLRELFAAMALQPAPTVDLGSPVAADRGVFVVPGPPPERSAEEDHPDAVVTPERPWSAGEASDEGGSTDEVTADYSDEARTQVLAEAPPDPTDPLDERLPWVDAKRVTPRPPPADTSAEEVGDDV